MFRFDGVYSLYDSLTVDANSLSRALQTGASSLNINTQEVRPRYLARLCGGLVLFFFVCFAFCLAFVVVLLLLLLPRKKKK